MFLTNYISVVCVLLWTFFVTFPLRTMQQQQGELLSYSDALEKAFQIYRAGNIVDAHRITLELTKVATQYAHAFNFLGVLEHERNDLEKSIQAYDKAISLDSTALDFYTNKGYALKALDKWEECLEVFLHVVTRDPTNKFAWNGLGLAYHYTNNEEKSIESYNKALEIDENYAEVYYNKGVSLKYMGNVEAAGPNYWKAIQLNPKLYSAIVNLAALHQEHGDPEEAIKYFEMLTSDDGVSKELKLMSHTNMGTHYYVEYNRQKAKYHYDEAEKIIQYNIDNVHQEMQHHKDQELADLYKTYQRDMTDLNAHRSRLAVSTCDWENFDENLHILVEQIKTHYLTQRPLVCCTPLMVFDTLLLPVTNKFRKQIGISQSLRWSENKERYPILTNPPYPVETFQPGNRLRLGYLSYDFNDHPTAHMIEGLFKHHRRYRVDGSAYSYGKNDNSVFRKRIEIEMDHFVDIVKNTYLDAVLKIRSDQIHILFDLQCHTRGSRPEISAMRPAPISVNLLIFPGTNGANWLDYLIADKYVAPPEQGEHFVEKLIYLPDTYQVNYYPINDFIRGDKENISLEPPGMRDVYYTAQTKSPKPPTWATFVFANFNKIDKLEPESFRVWMQILRRVPGSVLWLLQPSEKTRETDIEGRIVAEAAAAGVHRRRIVFAPRRSKRFHLARFKYADLFIDTFVYGAHSTATDALRGGLPVLTFQRNNFASRVATSLLHNVGQPYMSMRTIKSYEDTAVNLATSHRHILKKMKFKLTRKGMPSKYWPRIPDLSKHDANKYLFADGSLPLFDIKRYTYKFEKACQIMWDVYKSNGKPMNLVIEPGTA